MAGTARARLSMSHGVCGRSYNKSWPGGRDYPAYGYGIRSKQPGGSHRVTRGWTGSAGSRSWLIVRLGRTLAIGRLPLPPGMDSYIRRPFRQLCRRVVRGQLAKVPTPRRPEWVFADSELEESSQCLLRKQRVWVSPAGRRVIRQHNSPHSTGFGLATMLKQCGAGAITADFGVWRRSDFIGGTSYWWACCHWRRRGFKNGEKAVDT